MGDVERLKRREENNGKFSFRRGRRSEGVLVRFSVTRFATLSQFWKFLNVLGNILMQNICLFCLDFLFVCMQIINISVPFSFHIALFLMHACVCVCVSVCSLYCKMLIFFAVLSSLKCPQQ